LSWDDFLEAFKKRHPKEYGLDSGCSVVVKAPMPKVEAKDPEIKPQVEKAAVVEEDWDGAEEVEVEQDEYWR
jgi:hypothetical protein